MSEGGFGGGPWGGGPWGGSSDPIAGLVVLPELVVVGEALQVTVPFRVLAAASLSATLVRVDFSSFVNPAFSSPDPYTIPGLTVVDADPLAGSGKSVILRTSPQSAIVYTVSVDNAYASLGGDLVDPNHDTAPFLGLATTATFTAVAQSRRKILLTFSEPASIDAAFVSPTSYEVSALDGEGIIITAAQQTGPDNTRGFLSLGSDLKPGGYYVVKILPSVAMQSGKFVLPDQKVFQWKESRTPIRIAITAFSGEVTSGLLGEPAGQAFFSPALDVSVPNSVIEVDSVSVCTRAHDVYTIPSLLPDPLALFTWPPPLTGAKSEIGASGGVLNASAHRLGQAVMHVEDQREDVVVGATDGPATATFVETIDISRAAFLNDVRWRTFPGTGASEGAFILADNLTYIGPGPTSTITLQP